MTFWSTQFHKSDVEKTSQRAIDNIKDDVVQMQVVLGNANTQHSLVHDVETLNAEKEEIKETSTKIQSDCSVFHFIFIFTFTRFVYQEDFQVST